MEEKISIIIPCYNVENYISRCLDSLLIQTQNTLEIICINDGSTDQTLRILQNYKRKYKDKIILFNKKNEGVWKARQTGISIATGNYIGFVDADDYVEPNFVEILYNSITESQADIAVCGFDRIDMTTGKIISREMCNIKTPIVNLDKFPDKLLCLNAALWNKLYRADLLKNMDNLTNPPRILEDIMFLLLVCLKAKRISYTGNCLIHYIVRANSAINTVNSNDIDNTYQAMCEVKKIYIKKNPDWLELIDTMAFLHLGISLMFRISYDPNCNMKKILKTNLLYLNNNFSTWKNSKYISLKYMSKNGFYNWKLWIVHTFYRLNLFGLFLSIYRFMIDRLKIDIKW